MATSPILSPEVMILGSSSRLDLGCDTRYNNDTQKKNATIRQERPPQSVFLDLAI